MLKHLLLTEYVINILLFGYCALRHKKYSSPIGDDKTHISLCIQPLEIQQYEEYATYKPKHKKS